MPAAHALAFQYTDDEGDDVTLASDADLAEAFAFARAARWPSLKLRVAPRDAAATNAAAADAAARDVRAPPAVHAGATCDDGSGGV